MKPAANAIDLPTAPATGRPTAHRSGATLLATVAALGLIAACHVWFELSATLALAMGLAALVLGLTAHGISVALASRRRVPGARAQAAATGRARRDDADLPRFSAALNGKRWSLDVLRSIDAQRFAAVCETWFTWAGFDTRTEVRRCDSGVDIWLHAAKVPGPVAIVRCRHGRDEPVGLRDLQEFLQAMAPFQSVHGTYTTTSTYTPEALRFAREHGIDAVDGRGLLRRIQTRTRQRQQALLAVALSKQSFAGQP